MAISGDYAVPVFVNGYACNNCAQVAEAKQGVDPADPKAGPYGVDAKTNPPVGQSPAVIFGGVLTNSAGGVAAGQSMPGQSTSGQPTSHPPSWAQSQPGQASFVSQDVGGLLDLSV